VVLGIRSCMVLGRSRGLGLLHLPPSTNINCCAGVCGCVAVPDGRAAPDTSPHPDPLPGGEGTHNDIVHWACHRDKEPCRNRAQPACSAPRKMSRPVRRPAALGSPRRTIQLPGPGPPHWSWRNGHRIPWLTFHSSCPPLEGGKSPCFFSLQPSSVPLFVEDKFLRPVEITIRNQFSVLAEILVF
jgi:hypothetical protein